MINIQPAHSAGGYDWLEVWRQMYDVERAQAEAVTDPALEQSSDYWAARASGFASASQRTPQPDELMQRLLPHLRPDDTVLDIGAGTGRYVPSLARTVRHVLALEPSPAMRAHLEQRIRDEGLTNVEVLAEWWPCTPLPRASVALSAHVLYAVREIGPFLQAMDAAAERACYLFLMINHLNALFSPFWERFHGQARRMLPSAIEAFNVLYQLGIPAHFEWIPVHKTITFADRDEALRDIRHRLRLAPEPQRDAEIMAMINELLIHHEDGSLSMPGQQRQSALIWWQSSAQRNVSS